MRVEKAPKLGRKYQTRTEVTDGGKGPSTQWCRINYVRKKFYDTGPASFLSDTKIEAKKNFPA